VLNLVDIRKNLVSRLLLRKKEGFKMVFKSDIFFGKGLSINDLNIHIMIILTKDDDDDDSSFLLEPYDIWHARLEYINYSSIQNIN